MWNYFQSNFEYEKTFPDLAWPWAGHKYFIYDLIRNIPPDSIVELGTHRGTSFFSMCQPINDAKLNTKLYAVDSWRGEKHSGRYDRWVYEEVQRIKKKYYRHVDASLLKTTFDEGKRYFPNHSIDLLHIDGLHTYEAVNHDFNNWFPKVKKNGVIILHDIVERKKDFGVYKLWASLKDKFVSIEFIHSHGLGILFLDRKHEDLIQFQQYWQIYYSSLYQKFLGPFAERMQIQLDQQTAKNNEYLRRLSVIQSSKFYKYWQQYCGIKKKFRNLTSLQHE